MMKRRRLVLAALVALSVGLGGAENCQRPPMYRVVNLRPGGDPGVVCAASLRWDPPNPLPPAGIDYYEVFRSGVKIASPSGTAQNDRRWLSLFPSYVYAVRAVDNAGVAHGSSAIVYVPPNCPPPQPDPELATAVFLVKFADSQATTQRSEADQFVFGATSSVRAYWEEVSYHSQTFTRVGPGPFSVTLPLPASFYCASQNYQGYWQDCDTPAMVSDFMSAPPFSDWAGIERSIMVVYDYEDRGSTYDIVFADGSRVANVIIPVGAAMDVFDVDIMVHELGHRAGASHASTVVCPNGGFPPDPNDHNSGGCHVDGQTDQYRDYRDPMGKGSATDNPINGALLQHFGAYHKELMGFFSLGSEGDPYRIRVVTPTASGVQAELWPLERTPYLFFPFVIKIPLNDIAHYSVEYRSTAPQGFIVRLVQGRRGGSLQASTTFLSDPPVLLDEPGDAFEDLTQDVRIEFVSHYSSFGPNPANVRILTANE